MQRGRSVRVCTKSAPSASLTEQVVDYQQSGRGYERLIERIALEIYTYPRGRGKWNEDDASDFFCYFFPKVPALINRFVFHGRPFEVYLKTTMKLQLRTFAVRRTSSQIYGHILTDGGFWAADDGGYDDSYAGYAGGAAMEAAEPESTDPAFLPTPEARRVLRIDHNLHIIDPTLRKRFLFLVLKGAASVSGHMIRRAAVLASCDAGWIFRCVDALRDTLAARRERLCMLRERRNHYYFRMFCMQEELKIATDEESRRRLADAMCLIRTRLAGTLEEISRVPLTPTHKDIAEVMGVPKGSVDSGLYYLRSALAAL
jgi:hypothetical protein